MRFAARGSFAVEVTEPLVAAALARLEAAWPRGAWFKDLITSEDAAGSAQRESLANVLLAAFVLESWLTHVVNSVL